MMNFHWLRVPLGMKVNYMRKSLNDLEGKKLDLGGDSILKIVEVRVLIDWSQNLVN